MPRAPRYFVDGAIYHVYARTARGERLLASDSEAGRLVGILRDVKRRDGLTILAWCVMGNHYHLALRTSSVPLWRTMRLVQWRFARDHNRGRRQLGPVWQGRYQVRNVEDEAYLLRLIAYIHLNPVTSGLVKDPAAHRWSGHREVLGKSKEPLVDVDAVLALFGGVRSEARAAYLGVLRGEGTSEWVGEEVGRLPWWRKGDGEMVDGSSWGEASRPVIAHDPAGHGIHELGTFLRRACDAVGLDLALLASRTKARDVARARELIAVVAVERYGVRVGKLAAALGMHLGSVSRWITRAARRRNEDPSFAYRCVELEDQLGHD